MFTGKSFIALAASFFIMAGHGMAITCGRLEKVSSGEDHSLVLSDDGTLWSCGWNENKVLGLGASGSAAIFYLTLWRI
jgi:alpha-tubulin suppressor-like RCC1 family protein